MRPGQVVIETHCESYVFLPKFMTSLQTYALNNFCGVSLDMMTTLKNKMEHINPNLSELYVLNHDMLFPLKHRAMVIDSLSFNDHSLSHNYFPLHKLEAYLHTKNPYYWQFPLLRCEYIDEQMNHYGFELGLPFGRR